MVVKIIFAAALASMLSGCVVVFTNPLPASQPIGHDERLLGKWEGEDEQGNSGWIRFEMPTDQIDIFLSGDWGYHNPAFRAVTTNISGDNHMILRVNDPALGKEYMVVRYSINGDTLTLCLLNADKVRAAIKDRKIKGKLGYSQWSGAVITESSKNVLGFLKSPGSKDLFTCLLKSKKVPSK